jgi:hypothetical protein
VFLSDLEADAGESKNVAAEHPDVVARLVGPLDRWVAKVTRPPGGRPE